MASEFGWTEDGHALDILIREGEFFGKVICPHEEAPSAACANGRGTCEVREGAVSAMDRGHWSLIAKTHFEHLIETPLTIVWRWTEDIDGHKRVADVALCVT